MSSPAIGLCSDCAHARVQRSAKGAAFWRCLRADADPRYLRYPPLPVIACAGFEPGSQPTAPGPRPQRSTNEEE